MNRLPSVIGPAPSELPIKDFLAKLRGERSRVSEAIQAFKAGRLKTKGGAGSGTIAAAKALIKVQAMKLGLSEAELTRLIEEDMKDDS